MTLSESISHYRLQFLATVLLICAVYRVPMLEMAKQWYEDPNYSHGFLVPFVAAWFVYRQGDQIAAAVIEPWWPGFVVLVLGMLQLMIGSLAAEYFTIRTSLVVVMAGLVLIFFGKGLLRRLWLPLGYLLFMVPLPYIVYDSVAFPLKLFVTGVSIRFLKLIGVVVWREGNIIMLPQTTLEVADACSGIRSLISLLALAVAYAFLLKLTPARRMLLIAVSIPIALFANAVRVIGTGILAQHWGAAAAEGFFHEFAGMAVFALAIVLLVATGSCLNSYRGGER